jgi:hypothetical protein
VLKLFLLAVVAGLSSLSCFAAHALSTDFEAAPFSVIKSPTAVAGIGPNRVSPLDLTKGYGPTLTNCLTDTLHQFLGQDAVYQGQVSGGGTRVLQGGAIISFYVLRASDDASQGSGLRLLASNALNVGTSCGNMDLVPALYNPAELGAALTSQGLSARILSTGVIIVKNDSGVSSPGNVFVVRPDYLVMPGQPAGPRLEQGAVGLYRFTDSAGNSQVLRAAFLLPGALQAGAGPALGGSLVIQIDGTALFTHSNGTQSVLSPDLILGTIPAASAASNWWTDGPNRYRYPIGVESQGLTQTSKDPLVSVTAPSTGATGETASTPNLVAVQFVKTEIRGFLARHPGSADTIEGIQNWWIRWPGIPESMSVTAAALASLEGDGVLMRLQIGNSVIWRDVKRM